MSDVEHPLVTDSNLEEKWGDSVNAGFVVIPSALLLHQNELKLDSGEVVVLMNLLMAWWKVGDLPFPRTSTIAKRMGINLRTVQRCIESLEKKRLIKRLKNLERSDSNRVFTRYDLSGIVSELKRLGKVGHPSRKKNVNLVITEKSQHGEQ